MDKYDEEARALLKELFEERAGPDQRAKAIAAFGRRCAEEARAGRRPLRKKET